MSGRARYFVIASIGVVAWVALRLRLDETNAARRVRSLLRASPDKDADESSRGAVRFEWVMQPGDAEAVQHGLNSKQIAFASRDATDGVARAALLRRKLAAVGMHFDQEPPAVSYEGTSLKRLSGVATPDRLAETIELALKSSASGVSVDTTASIVEIDQQSDLSRNEIVLIDPHKSYQLRAGTRRVLYQALQEAAERLQPLQFRPIPNLAQLRHEMADLPPTLDELIAALEEGTYSTYLSPEHVTRLGTMRRCDHCGTPIVDIAALSDLLARFYGKRDRRQEIARALAQSGLEVEDQLNPRYCRIHGQMSTASTG